MCKSINHLQFFLNSYNKGIDFLFLIPKENICKEEKGD